MSLIDELNDAIRLREVALEGKANAEQNAKRLADLLAAEKQNVHLLQVQLGSQLVEAARLKGDLGDARRRLEQSSLLEAQLNDAREGEKAAKLIADELGEQNEDLLSKCASLKSGLVATQARAARLADDAALLEQLKSLFDLFTSAHDGFLTARSQII